MPDDKPFVTPEKSSLLQLIPEYHGEGAILDFITETCRLAGWTDRQVLALVKPKLKGTANLFAKHEPARVNATTLIDFWRP